MKICISSGHGLKIRGASGYIDEVDEARKVVESVADNLRAADVEVETFHDDVSTSQNENLNRIVNWHNSQDRDLDVSVHFNAYQTTSKAMGCEVLYVSQADLAAEVSAAIADAGAFIDRGPKYRSDLFFLNSTDMPAVLLETCFVDSSVDTELYHQHYDSICRAIAETISGESVPIEPTEPEQPDTPEPPEPGSGDNRVDVVGRVEGQVAVFVNGSLVSGRQRCPNVVRLRTKVTGDVVITVNGQEMHNKPDDETPERPDEPASEQPVISDNHRDIEATVFGGSDDPNNSAYPPFDMLDGDNDLFVALPYSWSNNLFPDNAPRVRVFCGELSAEAVIADKGPWMIDDEDYVMGDARPLAETCHDEGTPLPRGPNAGKVPSNRAGIDLSPALADMIGIEGKGTVDWCFINEEDDAATS